MTLMFLTGDGMRGGRLHHELRGAPLVAVTRTAARYRFYDVGGRYPALEPVPAGGYAIAGEVYDVPLPVLRDHLLPAEPPELELGIAELADGAAALAMLLRQGVPRPAGLTDISGVGDWRAYRGIS
ncbi:MAG TPA: gamma-glutamylcyclotransferase [Streptosporangiaceae bacterium]|nr:gamma-glutamylcyclotransferase [Streptosporangiaceae bacterium]